MKTIKVRIPAIVTVDGKWAAGGSHGATGHPDWEWLDESCDFENPTKGPQKMWIEAELPVPEETQHTITGTVVPD